MRFVGGRERGSAVIETTFLMGLVLMIVLAYANLATNEVIKGMAHSAVDQGVRAGARQDVASVAACEARTHQVLDNILMGPAGAGSTVNCTTDGDVVMAHVTLHLDAWIPPMRDADVVVTGEARKEGLR